MLKENGIHCLKISQIYFTSPWGFESKNEFLNMVLLARTFLSPWELLLTLKKIETKLGRKSVVLKSDFRKKRYEDRVIDIDIIFYENEIIKTKILRIPHPLTLERAFVLIPALEVAPNWIHPEVKKTLKEIFTEKQKELLLQKINPLEPEKAPYFLEIF